ncbi:MAG: polysaccharide pyruvyl transferase family protein [Firmicutes bacterium]|nr:polysaccharide pyruvyl transferase family protein [Bacillota bacterium]
MNRIYLSGQRTFRNRGCEAIVRSTVGLLRKQFPSIEVLVPSDNIERDRRQWPQAIDNGVKFVQAYMPSYARYWVNLQRLPVPALKRAGCPFPAPAWLKAQIASVDAVLAIGGDNYSLDYRIPSPVMGLDKLAMDMGKPVILWGASVGPFEREPAFVPAIVKHLARMKTIAVRETVSYGYLTEALGLKNVSLIADPAFNLQKEEIDLKPFWPEAGVEGVLGLNVSPLIERYKRAGQSLIDETVAFVNHVVIEKGMGVLLVPHVTALAGADDSKSDYGYMNRLISRCSDLGDRIRLVPDCYNAAQLKYIIGNLRYFIGARTHATIAAMSSRIPTVSIAYSVKAQGINRDLFGSEEMVLPTPELSSKSLMSYFDWLVEHEVAMAGRLETRVPELQILAAQAVSKFF